MEFGLKLDPRKRDPDSVIGGDIGKGTLLSVLHLQSYDNIETALIPLLLQCARAES